VLLVFGLKTGKKRIQGDEAKTGVAKEEEEKK
jgi:hypothetical protein